jgi:hypothetical protein
VADRAAELLRKKLEEQEARTERLRIILKCLEDDPALATELYEILKNPEANGYTPRGKFQHELPPNPNLEPILAVFKAKGEDEWVTVNEICEVTGLTRHLVNTFLREGRHRDMFESHLQSARRMYFRLKKDREETPDDRKPKKAAPKSGRPKKKPPSTQKEEGKPVIRSKWQPGAEFVLDEESGDTKRIK